MPLGTLDRTPPAFFKQGPSALSKLAFFSSLAIFLMVADTRLTITGPLRAALVTGLYPAQWLVSQPVKVWQLTGHYFQDLDLIRNENQRLSHKLAAQSARTAQVEQLTLENERLRALLGLREQVKTEGMAAQVLYDAADPYSKKVIIDKGTADGITTGAPVLDETGILGQVTRAHPLVSEVTLLTDREQAIPVLNTRTGVRSVAYGVPGAGRSELELRFMAGNADVQEGDMLSTSGIDGIYPPGLPVARVTRVERRAESAFARITCTPFAQINSAMHVLVLQPVGNALARPEPELRVAPQKGKSAHNRR